jgi:hypothetical protein
MDTARLLEAGVATGLLANGTGYLITGRVFHRFQAGTPDTWRKTESWAHYTSAAVLRILACVGVSLLYGTLSALGPQFSHAGLLNGLEFGAVLWSVTVLPTILETALFVNWDPRFVLGLLLDWLIVITLASVGAATMNQVV